MILSWSSVCLAMLLVAADLLSVTPVPDPTRQSASTVRRTSITGAQTLIYKAFYAGYFDPDYNQPFYRPSSRI